MTGFGHLMAPGRIGAMSVRNRLVMSPMETMYGTPDGLPSERTRDYFAARARGGVGLITLGANGVDELNVGAAALSGWPQRLLRPAAIRFASRAWMPIGRRVVIVGGDLVALELAEFLASQGRLVAILEAGKDIAPEVGNKRKTEHMDRLDRLGVTVHVRAATERITADAVEFTPAGGTTRRPAADTVVPAGAVEPDTALFGAIVDALPGAEVHAVGDCTGLGLIRKATEEGARAACAI
ncbi:FAD-dependent oxidoreductase [Mycolicibacterium vulneris]|uniref:FAD-dependent oxidoreductase n=1 Tax=Mycolicibacterium vulneris TaxID=547163 RepID=UPI001FE8B442|nr:FAD-dependent oxidoreductase [Mycolicibacterium vulneris]